jgi:hypothetical protein
MSRSKPGARLACITGVEGVTITFFSPDVGLLVLSPLLLFVEVVEGVDFVDSQPAIVKNMQMKIE